MVPGVISKNFSPITPARLIKNFESVRIDDQALFSGLAQRILAQYQGKRELVKLMLYSALESHDLSRMFRQRQFLPVEMFLADYVRLRQEEGAFVGGDPRCIAQSFIWVCNHQVLLSELFGAELGIPGDDQAVNTFTSLFLNGVRSPRPACDRNHQNEL